MYRYGYVVYTTVLRTECWSCLSTRSPSLDRKSRKKEQADSTINNTIDRKWGGIDNGLSRKWAEEVSTAHTARKLATMFSTAGR